LSGPNQFKKDFKLAIKRGKKMEKIQAVIEMLANEGRCRRGTRTIVLSPAKVSPPLTQLHEDAAAVFKDAYIVDFLNLPESHSEGDLRRRPWRICAALDRHGDP
jgi:hypothetical protein